MTVATEITRLQQAKADLKTAIEGKGVTVPSTALISDYAALVDNITSGGLEYLGRLYDHSWKLSETGYATWTPSTTAAAILTGAATNTFVATNIKDAPYFWRTLIEIEAAYPEGTAHAKGQLLKIVASNWYAVSRRSSTLANMQSENLNYNVVEAIANSWVEHYYSSATATTLAFTTSYGLYPVNVAGTVSSSTVASPTITPKFPTLNARVNSTYFASSFASNIDQENTTIRMVTDYYRATAGYNRTDVWREIDKAWNNGLDL